MNSRAPDSWNFSTDSASSRAVGRMPNRFQISRRRFGMALIASSLIAAGCRGENRPNVEVIGGADTASVSDIDVPPDESGSPGTIPAAGSGAPANSYVPTSNVAIYFAMCLDLRDMRTALNPPSGAPDWARALAIYEQGKNQINPNGTPRSLASLLNEAAHAVYPNGLAVYGRPNFVDGIIRDGLNGTGRARGLSDDARKQIVDRGVLMLFHAKALQEFAAARGRFETSAANPIGPLDETFAIVAGSVENGTRPFALLAIAAEREKDFRLEGKLRDPLETALVAARSAVQRIDRAAFARAYTDGTGYLNAIFFLSTLRAAGALERDTTLTARQVRLAEGWAFWQSIRAVTANASPQVAQDIEAALSRDASAPWTAADTDRIYAGLHEPAVLTALGIPTALQIKSPPSP